MPLAQVLDLGRAAVEQALLIAGPLLSAAIGVGVGVSVVQAVTSVQEQTLSFVPKLLAVVGAFLALLDFMLQSMMDYTIELFRSLPNLVG